jgi:predicted DNA-binding protein
MKKAKSSATKQISIRLSAKDYERLELAAEKDGTTIADIARQRIQQGEKQLDQVNLMQTLLKHITKRVFVITSEIANLDDEEKGEALSKIESSIGKPIL